LTGLRTSGEVPLRTLEEKQQFLSVSKDTKPNSNFPISRVIFSELDVLEKNRIARGLPTEKAGFILPGSIFLDTPPRFSYSQLPKSEFYHSAFSEAQDERVRQAPP
jgi:hypothetical protein